MNPTLSVIVIAYNNELYIEEALESLAVQTYSNIEVVVVNDYSTDATGELMDKFVEGDSRFKAVHLSENSGGCSVPRNTGIANSTGKYIMFLDGDDWYPNDACEKMVEALEYTGSDFVCGQVIRTNTYQTWYGNSLYKTEKINFNIREYPEMLFDSLSVNKIYRREFLDKHNLRFLEGIHYEDILFSSMAYFYADYISVIPELMYYWRVVENANQKSITNRRFEIQNLIDRLKSHSYVDEFLKENGFSIYQSNKNNKFLKHDLKLYINDYNSYDEQYKKQFFTYVQQYLLKTIDIYELKKLNERERILCYFLYTGDREAFEDYFRFTNYEETKMNRLLFKNGQCYFKGTKEHKTDSSFLSVNATFKVGIKVLKFHVNGNNIKLKCEPIVKELGAKNTSYELVFLNRTTKEHKSISVDFPTIEATIPMDNIGTYDLYVRVTHGNYTKLIRLSAQHVYNLTTTHFNVNDKELYFYATKHGNISLRIDAPTNFSKFMNRAKKSEVSKKLSHYQKRISTQLSKVIKSLMYRLSVKDNLIFFESHMGKQYSDNPKYMYEELLRTYKDMKVVWSFVNPARHDVPGDAIKVERGTLKHYYYMTRAKYWIDNQGLANQCKKKKNQVYIQTWHGTPLKKMGYDQKAVSKNKNALMRLDKQVSIWNYFISSNKYSTNIFRSAFGYDGKILEVGYPRNDVLVNIEERNVASLKEKIGIPSDKKVVLYVPTFRDWNPASFNQIAADMNKVVENLNDDMILLLRTHYLVSAKLPIYAQNVIDVSTYEDVQELYLISDALVTDYSSVMFDYAITKRPMIFYVPDYSEYVKRRGMYFNLEEDAPGPVCKHVDEFIQAINAFEEIPRNFQVKRQHFEEKFTTLENGKASKEILNKILTHKK